MAKTDWKLADTISPEDMNQIGKDINALSADNSVTDNQIGDRTISDTAAPTGDRGKIMVLLGWLANMIKTITGKPNWRTAPRTTLENAVKRNGDTMSGPLVMDTGLSNALSLKGGISNHVYMQYFSDRDNQDVRSAFTGFGTSSNPHFSIVNERENGEILLSTKNGSGAVKINSNIAHHAGNHNSAGDPHSQYALKSAPVFTGPVTEGNSFSNYVSNYPVLANGVDGSYTRAVILLHQAYDTTRINYNYCIGDFFGHRGAPSMLSRAPLATVHSHSAYENTRVSVQSIAERCTFVTCKYNGVKYVALSIPYNAMAMTNGIYFRGYIYSTAPESLKYIEYYNEQTSTAINTEINNSIVELPANNMHYIEAGGFQVNGSPVLTTANHNSSSDPHNQYLLKTGGTMTGALAVNQSVSAGSSEGRNLIAGPWGDVSSNSDGHFLISGNAYTTGNNEYRYAKTHSTVGARGIRFSAFGGGLHFFETGSHATTADVAFTPSWKKIWNETNMGRGSGMNADLLDDYHASQGADGNTVAARDGGGSLVASAFRVHNPNNSLAQAYLGYLDDTARIRVGGSGVGASSGFEIQGAGDKKLFRASDNGQLTSYAAQGTSPFVVSSTTRVGNLNADMLDDCHATALATPNTVAIRGASGTIKAAAPQAADDVARKAETDAVAQASVPRGVNNQSLAFIQTLLMPTDTRAWSVTAWDGDKPATILIKDGATTVCTLTMSYNDDKPVTMIAQAGATKVTWSATWNGEKLTGYTKAVTS
ncbi:hypothetical protein D3P09_11760 [Paenibacillus pinisoli]|uniref:Uncharacterized protein n=1 Tax=Paenibacillus pinisoli TaxID=1276110 RepID=A0A3A6Q241_9BACL|nr:hypothetical protein [Paenibacillus pinisoli]RJX40044.1 hypothetical protein D3P09_11760 [Paenibacillus pinisoli]